MDTKPSSRTPRGSGCLITGSIFAGVAAGLYYRQTSIGFLVGVSVGLFLAIAAWLLDRRR